MKINGIQGMLGAIRTLMAVAIVGTSAMMMDATVLAGDLPRHYSDDAIVRDLKAGKLTVREAQMLRERRERAAAPVASVHAMPPVHAAKPPPQSVKQGKPALAKKPARAPIRHLTTPHSKKSLKAHGKQLHAAQHQRGQRHNEHPKAVYGKPLRPAAAHVQHGTAVQPVQRQAIKYIR